MVDKKGGEHQVKQSEWLEQWSLFQDQERFLFEEWIYPFTYADFQDRQVIDCGCGGGQHTHFIAPYAARVLAVDLNAVPVARARNQEHGNVAFLEADIARMSLKEWFDVVMSIGVVHHTDDPGATVANLKRHLAPGGLLLLWVYSWEGNGLMRWIVEPVRRTLLTSLKRSTLVVIARVLTAVLYLPVHTLYRLPLGFLPYYAYFQNFRRLSFSRNVLNVFDKLNAPQVAFITREQAEAWVADLDHPLVTPYKGVSWRISGRLPQE